MQLHQQARITLALAVLALLAGALNFLALNDIHHRANELSLEWSIVRHSNFIFLVFLCSSLWTVIHVLRTPPPPSETSESKTR